MASASPFQIIDPIEDKNWDDMLLSTPGASFFHSSMWARTLYEAYGYTPVYLSQMNGKKLTSLLPCMDVDSVLTGRRGVSLPFTDYCEPIANDNVSFREMFTHMVKFGKEKGWKYMEIRGASAFYQGEPCSSFFYGHTLALTPKPEELFTTFRDSTRRNIKKALKEDVETRICRDMEGVKAFYDLNCMTRRQHGLPPQPFTFFKKVHEHIFTKNHGFIVLAFHKSKPIAGNIYFHFLDTIIYKYGASDISYQSLRANNLIMWKAIEWGCNNGFKTLCMGRTEPENEGLRQFKTGWGTREHMICYFKYDTRRAAFVQEHRNVSPFQRKVFSKLPIPILNTIGTLLYKHVG